MKPQRAEIFALTVQLIDREADRYLVRAHLRGPGLSAHVGTVITTPEWKDLLGQVERQYADFSTAVRWQNRASPQIRLAWRLDGRGHLEGRVELRDPAEGWIARVEIKGDQSYLPRVALGLRLLLRPEI